MTSGPRHRGAKPAGFAGFACEGLQAIATARLAGYRYRQACRLSLQAGLQAIATARLAGYRYSQACRLSRRLASRASPASLRRPAKPARPAGSYAASRLSPCTKTDPPNSMSTVCDSDAAGLRSLARPRTRLLCCIRVSSRLRRFRVRRYEAPVCIRVSFRVSLLPSHSGPSLLFLFWHTLCGTGGSMYGPVHLRMCLSAWTLPSPPQPIVRSAEMHPGIYTRACSAVTTLCTTYTSVCLHYLLLGTAVAGKQGQGD